MRGCRGAVPAALLLAAACATAPMPHGPGRQREEAFETVGRALVYLPQEYERSAGEWPLILFLHGAGERGSDLSLVKREGVPHLLERLAHFPFVVLSPQCPAGKDWSVRELSSLLTEVEHRYRIDRTRISVTGLSSGALAALRLAIREPDRIAAVVAVAPHAIPADLCRMRAASLWLFQNLRDDRVPVRVSRRIARRFEECGGCARLTIFPRDGHDAWTEAYADGKLYEWLLSRRRGGLPEGGVPRPGRSPPSESMISTNPR